jgi:hypothetical protein
VIGYLGTRQARHRASPGGRGRAGSSLAWVIIGLMGDRALRRCRRAYANTLIMDDRQTTVPQLVELRRTALVD